MILTALVALTVTAVAGPDPLAPARDGQVACYRPDLEQKTCRAIASYRFEADGRIINDAENMLNASPLVVLRARNEVFIRDSAECSSDPFTEASIVGVDIDGRELPTERLAEFRSALSAHQRETIGTGDYCTAYQLTPDGSFRTLVTVDGLPRPEAGDIVLWVRREDGWRVAP